MNADPDYSYAEAPYVAPAPSIQLPFALLSCTIALFMVMQTQAVFRQKQALQEGKTQMTDAFAKREPIVKQSGELKEKLNKMVEDLLILGKTDEDAKVIIGKYNIQKNLPVSAPDATAPK